MKLSQVQFVLKKVFLFIKSYAWIALIIGAIILGFIIWITTRKNSFMVAMIDLFDSKTAQNAQEIETLNVIYNNEMVEKNLKKKEYEKRILELDEDFRKKEEKLTSESQKRLKNLIDEGHNDPEALSRKIAAEFGLEHG